MSIKDLSIKLGCVEQSLHRIIQKNSASLPMIEQIADALEVSPAVFFSSRYNDKTAYYREVALSKEIESLRQIIARQERTIDRLRAKQEVPEPVNIND